jgi:hypothetical protein
MTNMEIVLIANIQQMIIYECITRPFEGFFVSSVEFCKHIKFDDRIEKVLEIIEKGYKASHELKVKLDHKEPKVQQVHKGFKVQSVLMEHKVHLVRQALKDHQE